MVSCCISFLVARIVPRLPCRMSAGADGETHIEEKDLERHPDLMNLLIEDVTGHGHTTRYMEPPFELLLPLPD